MVCHTEEMAKAILEQISEIRNKAFEPVAQIQASLARFEQPEPAMAELGAHLCALASERNCGYLEDKDYARCLKTFQTFLDEHGMKLDAQLCQSFLAWNGMSIAEQIAFMRDWETTKEDLAKVLAGDAPTIGLPAYLKNSI